MSFLEACRRLRKMMLLVKDKVAAGATPEDATVLATYAGLRPDPLRGGLHADPVNDVG